MRSCDHPDTHVQLHFIYNRASVNYDSSITVQDSKRYVLKPYPFQAIDLQYFEHQPYLTENGTLSIRVKIHVPDSDTYQQAMAGQHFPLAEAVHKMETQEPIYICPILPAQQLPPDEPVEDITMPMQIDNYLHENFVVDTMDKPLSNFLFTIITLIYTLMNLCLMIFIRCSFRPGGFIHYIVVQMIHMSLLDNIQKVKGVQLIEPLVAPPTEPTQPVHLLDLPIFESEDSLNSDPTSPPIVEQMTALISFSKTIMILLEIFFLCLVISTIVKVLILPLFFKSNICRQLCLSCLHNSQISEAHTTDIFLEIIHIFTGKQIRIYITTICTVSLSLFAGLE